MFAILPSELLSEPTLLLLGLFFLFLVFVSLLKKHWPTLVRISLAGVGLASLTILLRFGLFPVVERVERLYYRGHDQFYWGNRLGSNNPEERQEAAKALAALLKSTRSNVRLLVIQDLGECWPEEREIALKALVSFAKDEQESDFLRWKAEYAIGIMFFSHVLGDLGTEVEREPYQKKILSLGWDAVAREFAFKKGKKPTRPNR